MPYSTCFRAEAQLLIDVLLALSGLEKKAKEKKMDDVHTLNDSLKELRELLVTVRYIFSNMTKEKTLL